MAILWNFREHGYKKNIYLQIIGSVGSLLFKIKFTSTIIYNYSDVNVDKTETPHFNIEPIL